MVKTQSKDGKVLRALSTLRDFDDAVKWRDSVREGGAWISLVEPDDTEPFPRQHVAVKVRKGNLCFAKPETELKFGPAKRKAVISLPVMWSARSRGLGMTLTNGVGEIVLCKGDTITVILPDQLLKAQA